MRPLCDFPTDEGSCGKPATWSTEDLGDIDGLCDEHVNEALLTDTFEREALS